jgi:hypothetical protein
MCSADALQVPINHVLLLDILLEGYVPNKETDSFTRLPRLHARSLQATIRQAGGHPPAIKTSGGN